ncbi:MAG: 30S ribosomal protein S6 [Candidatus Makaraimicrobium thalassicum]|nr:MAG: 30S ribosomal protein S6 [Candidatus Omnitrophota bacterium]
MEKSRSYSGLFIITPEKQGAIDEVTGSIGSVISENSGNIVKENMMGKKALAYPIKKKNEGVYYEVTFTAAPEAVIGMMRQFRINTNILRTLIDRNE